MVNEKKSGLSKVINILDNKIFRNFYLFCIYFLIYAPVLILMIFSFNESRRMGAGFTGFTFKWYIKLFNNKIILTAIYNTFMVAIISSIISTVLGTFSAYGIYKTKSKLLKKTMLTVNNIPVINPDIVIGVSLMIWFAIFLKPYFGIKNGFLTLIIAHIVFCTPYVILSVLPKLKQMPKDMIEAAMDLGARPLEAFFKVVIPEIWSGIISGMMIAFTLSIDDFVISFFTTGNGVQNLSIAVNSMNKKGISPEINAISTILFISVFIMMLIINKRTKIEDI